MAAAAGRLVRRFPKCEPDVLNDIFAQQGHDESATAARLRDIGFEERAMARPVTM